MRHSLSSDHHLLKCLLVQSTLIFIITSLTTPILALARGNCSKHTKSYSILCTLHPCKDQSPHRSIPTQINPYTVQSLHSPIPTQSNPYTDQSLHRSIPTQINPYTVQSLHRSIPTQINPYTDQSLHSAMSVSASTGAMTNSSFWSNNRRSSQINFLRKPKHTYRHPSHGA